MAVLGCTQPNAAFELVRQAESAESTDGAGSDTSETRDAVGESGAFESGTFDDTSGGDDGSGGHDGSTDSSSSGETESPPDKGNCTVDGCGPEEYCAFPEGTVCGEHEAFGTCQPRPQNCPPERDPVLACDCNGWYDNPCLARQAGLDVVCRQEDECLCSP
jgi:hypothetical protein